MPYFTWCCCYWFVLRYRLWRRTFLLLPARWYIVRYIGYAELDHGYNFPKLKDSVSKEAYPNKSKIVHFLLNGEVDIARVSRATDIFSGEIIPSEVLVMHDGDFYWSNTLAYYVEKYNLRLPVDFEKHILGD